ncbi:MAG: hypothetical protein EBS97_09665, partial [Verrucomicrobia bacterium]|nr:hypothetical protein [Verrucomicrobiota bacterium]
MINWEGDYDRVGSIEWAGQSIVTLARLPLPIPLRAGLRSGGLAEMAGLQGSGLTSRQTQSG